MNTFTLITTFFLKLDVRGVKLKFYVKFQGVICKLDVRGVKLKFYVKFQGLICNFQECWVKFNKIKNYRRYFYNWPIFIIMESLNNINWS